MVKSLRAKFRDLLPEGRSLPEELWAPRHRGLVRLIFLHAVGVVIFAVVRGFGLTHGLVEGTPIAVLGLVANSPRLKRKMREAAVAGGLVLASAVLVHLSGGKIEMHFHYFVVVGLLTLYQDWYPFLLAVGFVLIDHAVIGVVDPHSVYDHTAALNNPYKWALIHALLLAAASVANLLSWRLNEHQSLHDSLTGLANRTLLSDRISHALARLDRNGGLIAALFLDLDEFKAVNDGLGHGAGDELLVTVANRLKAAVRSQDTACRLGGDEFAVLLEDVSSPAMVAGIAQRVLDSLNQPMVIKGREVKVRASMGVAFAASDDNDADELLRNADMAMYAAKKSGKGRFEIFEPSMHEAVMERLELEFDLRHAVDRGELVLHYQPIVGLADGHVISVEALIRWNHPRRGMVAPLDFLPLAEESGTIVEIGTWVLNEACRQVASWQQVAPEMGPIGFSVNLSARQFQDPHLVARVQEAVATHGIDPRQLVLEITESILMVDTAVTDERLAALRAIGVRIAIDDFGTGYSSLSYLRRFEVDVLKVDRSFINQVTLCPKDSALAEAIVAMARALSLDVVPEGIEHLEQVERLRAWGCESGQGFLFAKPMPAIDIELALTGGHGVFDAAFDRVR